MLSFKFLTRQTISEGFAYEPLIIIFIYLNGYEDTADHQAGPPVSFWWHLEDIEANYAGSHLDLRVKDHGKEFHVRRFEGIAIRNQDLQLEKPSFVRRVVTSYDLRLGLDKGRERYNVSKVERIEDLSVRDTY